MSIMKSRRQKKFCEFQKNKFLDKKEFEPEEEHNENWEHAEEETIQDEYQEICLNQKQSKKFSKDEEDLRKLNSLLEAWE